MNVSPGVCFRCLSSRSGKDTVCVQSTIKRLPEKYREALELTEYQGLSQKELSEKLGMAFLTREQNQGYNAEGENENSCLRDAVILKRINMEIS